jgi:hypothetical protein
MAINGMEIDAAAGPPDMRRRDSSDLFGAAVDVTSLPGMFSNGTNGNKESYDEAQRTTEMAATLLSTAIGKRAQIHNLLWKTLKRHALQQIKGESSLFTFVKAVGKAEGLAFKQQENGFQLFMYNRHYDTDVMDEYIQHGFLPRLTHASFRYYENMLSTVRQLAFDHAGQTWEKGPAQAMLQFHSNRLLQIRSHALTQKSLVLQTYCYLRDAAAKSFYHESMTEALWNRFAELQTDPNE